MRQVNALDHGRRVVRVHVADKTRFHFEASVLPGPVFQRQIHRPGTQVAAADADLGNRGELLALFVGQGAVVHFLREIRDLLLLFGIEHAFVRPFGHDVLSQLSAGQLVQHQPLFPGIDYRAVEQLFKLFAQLRLPAQRGQTG